MEFHPVHLRLARHEDKLIHWFLKVIPEATIMPFSYAITIGENPMVPPIPQRIESALRLIGIEPQSPFVMFFPGTYGFCAEREITVTEAHVIQEKARDPNDVFGYALKSLTAD